MGADISRFSGKTVDTSNNSSAFEDFGNSLVNSAIQNPVNSLSQIGSAISGVKLPEIHYFDPAEPTNGTQKFAEQAGGVIGMMVPFLIASKTVGWSGSKLGLEASGSTLSVAAKQGATGAVMGFALTPSNDGLYGRFKNAAVDAGTFAVLGASGAKLSNRLGELDEMSLAGRIVRSSLIGIGSSIPGGFANAELNAVVNKGQLASLTDIRDDVASFAMFGGLLGGIDALHSGKTVTAPSEMQSRFPTYSRAESELEPPFVAAARKARAVLPGFRQMPTSEGGNLKLMPNGFAELVDDAGIKNKLAYWSVGDGGFMLYQTGLGPAETSSTFEYFSAKPSKITIGDATWLDWKQLAPTEIAAAGEAIPKGSIPVGFGTVRQAWLTPAEEIVVLGPVQERVDCPYLLKPFRKTIVGTRQIEWFPYGENHSITSADVSAFDARVRSDGWSTSDQKITNYIRLRDGSMWIVDPEAVGR